MQPSKEREKVIQTQQGKLVQALFVVHAMLRVSFVRAQNCFEYQSQFPYVLGTDSYPDTLVLTMSAFDITNIYVGGVSGDWNLVSYANQGFIAKMDYSNLGSGWFFQFLDNEFGSSLTTEIIKIDSTNKYLAAFLERSSDLKTPIFAVIYAPTGELMLANNFEFPYQPEFNPNYLAWQPNAPLVAFGLQYAYQYSGYLHIEMDTAVTQVISQHDFSVDGGAGSSLFKTGAVKYLTYLGTDYFMWCGRIMRAESRAAIIIESSMANFLTEYSIPDIYNLDLVMKDIDITDQGLRGIALQEEPYSIDLVLYGSKHTSDLFTLDQDDVYCIVFTSNYEFKYMKQFIVDHTVVSYAVYDVVAQKLRLLLFIFSYDFSGAIIQNVTPYENFFNYYGDSATVFSDVEMFGTIDYIIAGYSKILQSDNTVYQSMSYFNSFIQYSDDVLNCLATDNSYSNFNDYNTLTSYSITQEGTMFFTDSYSLPSTTATSVSIRMGGNNFYSNKGNIPYTCSAPNWQSVQTQTITSYYFFYYTVKEAAVDLTIDYGIINSVCVDEAWNFYYAEAECSNACAVNVYGEIRTDFVSTTAEGTVTTYSTNNDHVGWWSVRVYGILPDFQFHMDSYTVGILISCDASTFSIIGSFPDIDYYIYSNSLTPYAQSYDGVFDSDSPYCLMNVMLTETNFAVVNDPSTYGLLLDDVAKELIVETQNFGLVGSFTFNLYIQIDVATSIYSYVTFTVNFIDGCASVALLTEPVLEDLTYIVNQGAEIIEFEDMTWQPECLFATTLTIGLGTDCASTIDPLPEFIVFDPILPQYQIDSTSIEDAGTYNAIVCVYFDDSLSTIWSETWTITVESDEEEPYYFIPTNNAPYLDIGAPLNQYVEANSVLVLNIGTPTDDDFDSIFVTWSSSAEPFTSFDSSSNTFTFAPSSMYIGSYTFTITLTDAREAQTDYQFILLVTVPDETSPSSESDSSTASNSTGTSEESAQDSDSSLSESSEDSDFSLEDSSANQTSSESAGGNPSVTYFDSGLGEPIEVQAVQNVELEDGSLVYPAYPSLESLNQKGELLIKFSQAMYTTGLGAWSSQDQSVLKLSIEPGQFSNQSELGFSWTVTEYAGYDLKIQLEFDHAIAVSSHDEYDTLVVEFLDETQFFDSQNYLAIYPGYVLDKTITQQIESGVFADSLEVLGEATQMAVGSSVVGTFLINIFVAGSLQQVWGMVNNLQLISHLPLFTVQTFQDENQMCKMPSETLYIFEMILEVTSFDIVPEQVWDRIYFWKDPNEGLTEWTDENTDKRRRLNETASEEELDAENIKLQIYSDLGYESSLFVDNMGTWFLVFTYFVIMVILSIIVFIASKINCIRSLYIKIKAWLFWNPLLRLMIEGYLEIAICCYINLRSDEFNMNTIDNSISAILSFTLTIFTLIFPFIVLYLTACQTAKTLKSQKYSKRFNSLYSDLRLEYKPLRYQSFFLFRRLCYCLVAIYLSSLLFLQCQCLCFLCIFSCMFIIDSKPFQNEAMNKLEVFNEINLLFLAYHLFCFTDFVPDSSTRRYVGLSAIFFTFLNVFVNIGFIVVQTCKQKREAYRQKKLQALRKKREDFRNSKLVSESSFKANTKTYFKQDLSYIPNTDKKLNNSQILPVGDTPLPIQMPDVKKRRVGFKNDNFSNYEQSPSSSNTSDSNDSDQQPKINQDDLLIKSLHAQYLENNPYQSKMQQIQKSIDQSLNLMTEQVSAVNSPKFKYKMKLQQQMDPINQNFQQKRSYQQSYRMDKVSKYKDVEMTEFDVHIKIEETQAIQKKIEPTITLDNRWIDGISKRLMERWQVQDQVRGAGIRLDNAENVQKVNMYFGYHQLKTIQNWQSLDKEEREKIYIQHPKDYFIEQEQGNHLINVITPKDIKQYMRRHRDHNKTASRNQFAYQINNIQI